MKYFIFFIFLSQTILYSQNTKIDSLLSIIETTKDLEKQSILYSKLSKTYENIDINIAVDYAEMGFKIAKQNNYKIGIAENVAALGDFYVIKNQLDEAEGYYLMALEYFKEEEQKLFDYTQITMIIGNINLAQNKFIKALKLYQECLDISNENNFNSLTPHLYNNLGELYLEIEDYDDAAVYFAKANKMFIELGDEYNAAQSLSNISNIHSKLGEDEKAIRGYLDVIRVFSINDDWADIARAYNRIAEIYIKKEEYQKADEYLGMALNTLSNKVSDYKGPLSIHKSIIYTTAAKLSFDMDKYPEAKNFAHKALGYSYDNSYKKNIFENARILSMIYDKSKQTDSALAYYKIYFKFNEEYQKESDVKRITQLKMQYEFDEILRSKEKDEFRRKLAYKRKELIYIGISIFTILAMVIMVLLYINQKAKTLKATLRHENLELEKEKLNRDIDYKKKELASNMMYLIEKNEFITTIARKLVEIKPATKRDNQHLIQQIINELKLNSSSKIWEEFEMRFKEVHSDFYKSLNEAFPDLTPNETKICAFLRLNMSSKEISSITHQSVKSINMARFRLRKKINMDREENLIAFLTNL